MADKTNIFETVLIFKDTLTEEQYDNEIKHYKDLIKKLPGTDIKTERLGKKELAYELRKHYKNGWFVIFTYKSIKHTEPLKDQFRCNDDILKFLTFLHDHDYKYEPDPDDSDLKPKSKPVVDVFDLIFDIKE